MNPARSRERSRDAGSRRRRWQARSAKASYVVAAGEDAGSKLAEAEELVMRVLDEAGMLALLAGEGGAA